MNEVRIHLGPDGWFLVEFPYSAEVVELIKELPRYSRRWDKDRRVWLVAADWIGALVRYLDDSIGRDPGWRMVYDEEVIALYDPSAQDDWRMLYILPDAPVEVVRAAYRALVQIHHPDRGGDKRTMQRINAAYERLQRRKAGGA